MYCRLYDLPAEGEPQKKVAVSHKFSMASRPSLFTVDRKLKSVNRGGSSADYVIPPKFRNCRVPWEGYTVGIPAERRRIERGCEDEL